MKIRILWVGKTKEQYLIEGIDRYLKLLGHTAQVSVVDIKEEKCKPRALALAAEGSRILKQTRSYTLLNEKGREFTSVQFSGFLDKKANFDFVIGGPYGVSDEVREKAADIISLSKMTFTHEMVRLVFLEQLYRAVTIIKGMEYHH